MRQTASRVLLSETSSAVSAQWRPGVSAGILKLMRTRLRGSTSLAVFDCLSSILYVCARVRVRVCVCVCVCTCVFIRGGTQPRPSLVYCASSLISPLSIPHFEWNAGFYIWGRHKSLGFMKNWPRWQNLNTLRTGRRFIDFWLLNVADQSSL
jgi:hypothetical protein